VAKPELGEKRQCQNCGAKFFDLNKDPILCPKCGTVFQATPLSARASRASAPADDEETDTDNSAELVPLEEADGDDDKAVASAVDDDADDIADDDSSDDDDTFLEEEEDGGDDVSDLIDGDIESDEER
jgi:uncharacterized protein (TIGR02300 family)